MSVYLVFFLVYFILFHLLETRRSRKTKKKRKPDARARALAEIIIAWIEQGHLDLQREFRGLFRYLRIM